MIGDIFYIMHYSKLQDLKNIEAEQLFDVIKYFKCKEYNTLSNAHSLLIRQKLSESSKNLILSYLEKSSDYIISQSELEKARKVIKEFKEKC